MGAGLELELARIRELSIELLRLAEGDDVEGDGERIIDEVVVGI